MKAAKQLFITQPSLSNAVRDLENEMGIEIFIRNPKGITLPRWNGVPLFMPVRLSSRPSFWRNAIKSPVAHRELFSVSSQHYAFVVNAFVSLLKKSDMENTSSSFVKLVLGRLSTTSRTSVVRSVSYFLTATTVMF